MPDYMLTAYSQARGWRDIQVNGAATMAQAITLAEKASGCRVSHGRGRIGADFQPGLIIDAITGETLSIHNRKAKPEVLQGPADVLAAIAAVLAPQRKPRGDG